MTRQQIYPVAIGAVLVAATGFSLTAGEYWLVGAFWLCLVLVAPYAREAVESAYIDSGHERLSPNDVKLQFTKVET